MRIRLKDKNSIRELTDLAFQAVQDTEQEGAEVQEEPGRAAGLVPEAEDPDWVPNGEKHGRALERFRLALRKAGPKGKAIDDALILEGSAEAADGPVATLVIALLDLAIDALTNRHRRRRRREAITVLASDEAPK